MKLWPKPSVYRNLTDKKKICSEKGCVENYLFCFDLVDIEKMELETDLNPPVSSDERVEEIIEDENDSECAQVTEDDLHNDSIVSDSTSKSSSVDNHSGEKEPGEDITKNSSPSINTEHLSSNDLQISTEDVLLGFYKAFQKANRQLKRNDATLLELLREQNEIFKSQTALMGKLMSPH